MGLERIAVLAVLISTTGFLVAQSKTDASSKSGGAVDVTAGYAYLHANVPAGACGCFALNGGYAALAIHGPKGLSGIAEFTAAHGSNIAGSTQSITIVNYLFGPRYSWHPHSGRVSPYGQVLFGGSTETSNVAAVQHVTSFATSLGGGLNLSVNRLLGWNLVDVGWVHSQIPNGSNNRQNNLRVATGVTVQF